MNGEAQRVLVVDDEQAMRHLLRVYLTARGYAVWEAGTGEQALQTAPAARPDIILMDLCLPGVGGAEVTRLLREWTQTPIIILSVRDEESEKIAALEAGADDYLTKPFSPGELLARIGAALRRAARMENGSVFSAGDLTVDLARRLVRLGHNRIPLTPTEYDLLRVLIQHAGKVLTHRQLVREVWGGMCYEDSLHLVRVNVSNLRRKLEADPAHPRYILTEPGVGYRLDNEPAPDRVSFQVTTAAAAYDRLPRLPVQVLLENVRSLYNVGAFFRTCDAVGVDTLHLCGITGRPPGKEIHKTALGAEESVRWEYHPHSARLVEQRRGAGYEIAAVETSLHAVDLFDWRPNFPVCLVFGNEVDGVEPALSRMCDTHVRIPMLGQKHSLNVATAGGVALYELLRKYCKARAPMQSQSNGLRRNGESS